MYADALFLDHTFGPHLLQLCNRALFECLALNLYCLRGEQGALTSVINNRVVSTPAISLFSTNGIDFLERIHL